MKKYLYLLGGPLLWLASLSWAMAMGVWRCGSVAAVVVVHALALGGCMAILYHALRSVRREGIATPERERLWHFAAGFMAVLGMAAIGVTALGSAVTAGCGP